jgi:histidinol-phosphate aminotransferase
MDTVVQAGMAAAILDAKYTRSQCEKVMSIRRDTVDALRKLGFSVTDSKANFIFVSHDKIPAIKIAEYLRERKIIVRHFKKPERISNYLRISIGIKEHMEVLVEVLKEIREQYR